MITESMKAEFKKYMDCYASVETLYKNHVISNDLKKDLECDLLRDIINYMKSEVEE